MEFTTTQKPEAYPNRQNLIQPSQKLWANQTVFNLINVEATIVGFRLPSYMDGVNVAGYHLHFITDDKNAGGHLLDCTVRDATIEIDYTYKYDLALPENPYT